MFSRIIDLSHTIEPGMPVYPGTMPPEFEIGNTIEKDGFKETKITFFTHTGTHLDCPGHLLVNGFTTDNADISQFFGKAVLIDCTTIKAEKINLTHITPYFSKIKESKFVIIYTGWSKFWGQDAYFNGFPVIDEDVADYFISQGIKGIGLDAISIDPVGDMELPIHKRVFANHLIIIENLTNLNLLIDKDFYFSCFPLKIKEGDGSPVRAVAII